MLINCFELLSGLFINFSKSSIYPLRPTGSSLPQVYALLHCKIGAFPFTYLRLSLKPTSRSKDDWQPLLKRFDRRLAAWKGHSISQGADTCKLSAHQSPPLDLQYYILFFFLSQWVVNHIDQLMHAFFRKGDRAVWGGQCLTRWDTLCTPHSCGGLGILMYPSLQSCGGS